MSQQIEMGAFSFFILFVHCSWTIHFVSLFFNPFEKRISFVLKIIVYFPFIFSLYDYKTACSVQKQVRENVCLINRSLKACKTNVRSFLKNILKILSFKLILTIFNHFVLDFSSFDYFSFLWTIQIVCLSLDVFFWKTPFLTKIKTVPKNDLISTI